MATLITPPLDEEPWPTLGPQVCDFIEEYGVYGPGELAGQPYEITTDFRAQLYRSYEVYPQKHRAAGRRRFKRAYFEERKGTAKTERAMLLVLPEAHPDGPVRCDGFDARGEPVGRGLQSPYIPLVSYTVDQTEDLGFNVLRYILENSVLGEDFDIGLERILLMDARGKEAGKITPVAGSPNSRDGARTTFQHFDEPHRMTLPRLVKAESTMTENLYKRKGADPWALYTSTAGQPGEGSVSEALRKFAEKVIAGKADALGLSFFSRFAPENMPMDTRAEVRAALVEASGPNVEWSGDIDGLVDRWFEPGLDQQYYRRVWLNQWVQGSDAAFDPTVWAQLAATETVIPNKELVVLGFYGELDSLALITTVVETGYQMVEWSARLTGDDWTAEDREELDTAVEVAFEKYQVWRMYAEPKGWENTVDLWASRHGAKKVFRWVTARPKAMASAVRAYANAIADGDLTHDGDPVLSEHIGNARKHALPRLDTDDVDAPPLYTLRKENPDSPKAIVAAKAAVMSWEARRDALKSGAKRRKKSGAQSF